MTTPPTHNRERIAWTVLVAAFGACVGLAVLVPLTARYAILNSTREQTASIEVTSGTVLVTEPGQDLPVGVLSRLDELSEGALLETDDASRANLSILDPNGPASLATLQIYGNTDVGLTALRSPQFEWSPNPHRILLNVFGGRVRAATSFDVPRGVSLTIQTPHGVVILDQPSSASVEVTNADLTVVVRDGTATVAGNDRQGVVLAKGERTVVPLNGSATSILAAERNLVVSGDFQGPTPNAWQTVSRQDRQEEPHGTVVVETLEGRRVAHFRREGSNLNWAYVGLKQDINRDIRDYSSLRLHLLVQVNSQDIFNCGALGTECPVMVRLNFRDVNGNDREWLVGYFSAANLNPGVPLSCVTCSSPRAEEHVMLPPGTWIPYDSPNLIDLFSQSGAAPASITSIEVFASGHAFDAMATEIELLAQE